MKKLLQIALILSTNISFAQIEIDPSSVNAEMELKSQTKGMLLPRINKPSDVNTPREGLFIYNKEAKTPAFHDGSNWRMMSSSLAVDTNNADSLTYTIVNGIGFLSTGTHNLSSISLSGIIEEVSSPRIFRLSKPRDAKTIEFISFFYDSKSNGSNAAVIEIKVYKKGTSTPYFSYKYKNIKLLVYSMGNYTNEDNTNDEFMLQGKIFGWWDYIAGIGTAYDTSTGNPVRVAYNSF